MIRYYAYIKLPYEFRHDGWCKKSPLMASGPASPPFWPRRRCSARPPLLVVVAADDQQDQRVQYPDPPVTAGHAPHLQLPKSRCNISPDAG